MLGAILPLVVLIQSAYAINGRCRALVLGGGSDRGAFQAGAIAGLITYLPEGEAMWDVVQGNGIGAFNALLVSQTVVGDEASLNTTLSNFWLSFKRSMVYKSWWGGRVVGYYYRNGLYNASPLKYTVSKIFDGSFDRHIIIGVTDLQKSQYKLMNTSYFSNDVMLLGVQANFNSRGDFAVIDYQDSQYASGEIAFGVDVFSAIEYCRTMNYPDRFITVDIVLVNHATLEPYDAQGKNTLQNYNRFGEIQNYHNVFERIIVTKQNAQVNYRTEIIMPADIPNTSEYPFDYETRTNLKKMFNTGIQTVKTYLGK